LKKIHEAQISTPAGLSSSSNSMRNKLLLGQNTKSASHCSYDLTTTHNQNQINPFHSFIPFQDCGNKCDYVIGAIHIQFEQFLSVMYLWQTSNLPEI